MAMTLRLTDDEQHALRQLAAAEGISMQEAARRAVRDYVARSRPPGSSRRSRRSHHRGARRCPRPAGEVTEPVEYLDLDDLIELATRLLGDPPPIRDIGLLGSAVARPQTTVFGDDAYPDVWIKAAALLQSIVNDHALIDGNKRLGWLATAVFLDINGIPITTAANSDVYQLVIDIAAGDPPLDETAQRLRSICGEDPG